MNKDKNYLHFYLETLISIKISTCLVVSVYNELNDSPSPDTEEVMSMAGAARADTELILEEMSQVGTW